MKQLKSFGNLVPFLLFISVLVYYNAKPEKVILTPTQKNGIDTLYTEDSVYVIRFNIIDKYERIKTEYDGGAEDLRP